jgi:hypothetical protein
LSISSSAHPEVRAATAVYPDEIPLIAPRLAIDTWRTTVLTGYLGVTNASYIALVRTHIVGVATDPALIMVKIIPAIPVVVVVIVVAGHRRRDGCPGQGAD